MERYDYREAVKADIREWLKENRSMGRTESRAMRQARMISITGWQKKTSAIILTCWLRRAASLAASLIWMIRKAVT